jgi:hypothetical protein
VINGAKRSIRGEHIMQRLIAVVCVLTTALGGAVVFARQTRRHAAAPKRGWLVAAKTRPDLAVDPASVTRVKLASRKTKYRIGEMITIDLAVMNVSHKPVFICDPRATDVSFNAIDAAGKQVFVGTCEEVLHAWTVDSYRRIEPGYAVFTYFYLLPGYDNHASTIFQEKTRLGRDEERAGPANYFKTFFERDLFINLGDGYLDAKAPGTYTITAEYSNELVVIAPTNSKAKTATPLTITITD